MQSNAKEKPTKKTQRKIRRDDKDNIQQRQGRPKKGDPLGYYKKESTFGW